MTSILQTYDTWYRSMLNEGPDRCPPRHSSSSHPDFVGLNNGYVWCEQQTLPKRVKKTEAPRKKPWGTAMVQRISRNEHPIGINVNPGLINHGLSIRGVLLQ